MSEYKYRIEKIFRPTRDVVTLEICDDQGREIFKFKPGQYVMVSFRNERGKMESRHSFSIASSPMDKHSFRLGIKVTGRFTGGLASLKAGDEVYVIGPYGKFVFREQVHHDLVMIAGGIGITPFISILNYAAEKKLSNKLSLMYSNRLLADTAFYNEIRELALRNPNFRPRFFVTNEKLDTLEPDVREGRISSAAIRDFVGDVRGKTFFVCGPKPFMDAMKASLISLGADEAQIENEEFSMTPDSGVRMPLKNTVYALSLAALMVAGVFYLISPPSAVSAPHAAGIDPAALDRLNRAVYDHWAAITDAKNQAIADLNQRINAAASALAQAGGQAPATIPPPTPPVVTAPTPPVYIPPAPVARPRTRVS